MKIIINGACGRMGQAVRALCEADFHAAQAVALVDMNSVTDPALCTYQTLWEFDGEADCIIDFSSPRATQTLCRYAQEKKLPLVVATTGQTPEELAMLQETAKTVPVFYSANMSVGIALLVSLCKQAAQMLPNADIEIIETHHNRKADAPSGTALMLSRAIRSVRKNLRETFGRHGQAKRQKDEIGIHAVRMGNITGSHEVHFGTDGETVTLKHTAHSRSVFAEGAIAAAAFLVKQEPGMYDMQSMIH